MDVLNAIGIALQVIGVVVAARGVSRLHFEMTGKAILARKTPERRSASAHLGLNLDMAAGASEVGEEEWPDDEPSQIDYLRRNVRALRELLDSQRAWSKDEHDRLRAETATVAANLASEISGVRESVVRTRDAISGGRDGRGLRIAAAGLAVTAVGLFLTLVAAVC